MEIRSVVIVVVLVAIGAFAISEQDTIAFKPGMSLFPKWKWWVKKSGKERSWLMLYILAPFSDGWHFCKFVFLMCYLGAIAVVMGIWWMLPALYVVVYGAAFNWGYDY